MVTRNIATAILLFSGIAFSGALDTGKHDFTPLSPKQFGTTTRYWDCCKPSCAWPGQGPANPVRSCNADGWSTIDPNARSGCDGGPAFACSDHAPFAINDQLSYGTVAFGYGTTSPCCKCYKLDFTSGPVVGKSMVVQVTNSGGDLGNAQFDINIPGGGVGLFNGCKPQWGAPDNGWGNQYGGISSAGECYQLPSELWDGCLWRFNWFLGADNPTVDWYEVGCPPEITARTNCWP